MKTKLTKLPIFVFDSCDIFLSFSRIFHLTIGHLTILRVSFFLWLFQTKMRHPTNSELRRYYISLPVDDEQCLNDLGDVAKELKRILWPEKDPLETRRRYNSFNRSKVHVTLWACDLNVEEAELKRRLELFMLNYGRRLMNLKIRFSKLTYLAKTETRYIVACLDRTCIKEVEKLKRGLEKAFGKLGKSLLDRDTCQLHCSIVACTNLNVQVKLTDVLQDFRAKISHVRTITPSRLILTSRWNVLACGTFGNGTVEFPRFPTLHRQFQRQNVAAVINGNDRENHKPTHRQHFLSGGSLSEEEEEEEEKDELILAVSRFMSDDDHPNWNCQKDSMEYSPRGELFNGINANVFRRVNEGCESFNASGL